MKCQQAALGQFRQVNLQRLPGQQMHRDGVRTESVEHNQSVMPRRRFTKSQPGVAHDDARLGLRAAAQVGKIIRVPRDADHRRVKLIKGPFLVRSSITGGRPGPQAHHGNARRCRSAVIQFEDFPQRPGTMIVSQRLALAPGLDELLAVQGVAVNKIAQCPGLAQGHPRDAEEIAFDMQRSAVRTKSKTQRPIDHGETGNGRQTDDDRVAQVDRFQSGERYQYRQTGGEHSKQDGQSKIKQADRGFQRLSPRAQQAGEYNDQRIFDHSSEDVRCHQRVKNAPQHPATRNPYVK